MDRFLLVMAYEWLRVQGSWFSTYGSWLRVMAYAFENMKAWQDARKLVVEVYRLLDSFLKFKNYALCD